MKYEAIIPKRLKKPTARASPSGLDLKSKRKGDTR